MSSSANGSLDFNPPVVQRVQLACKLPTGGAGSHLAPISTAQESRGATPPKRVEADNFLSEA